MHLYVPTCNIGIHSSDKEGAEVNDRSVRENTGSMRLLLSSGCTNDSTTDWWSESIWQVTSGQSLNHPIHILVWAHSLGR